MLQHRHVGCHVVPDIAAGLTALGMALLCSLVACMLVCSGLHKGSSFLSPFGPAATPRRPSAALSASLWWSMAWLTTPCSWMCRPH